MTTAPAPRPSWELLARPRAALEVAWSEGQGNRWQNPTPGPAEARYVRVNRLQARLRPISAGNIGIFSDAPSRALRPHSMVTGNEMAGNRGGTMNHNVTQGRRGPLARIGRRVAAIVAECNYAQTQLTSLRNTPERF